MKKLILSALLLCSACAHSPPDDFVVIAHRGASYEAPEHTIASYTLAQQQGADFLELDLHLSKDNQLIVSHDPTVQLNGKKVPIAQLTVKELKQVEVGKQFNEIYPQRANVSHETERIVTLEEVFEQFGSSANYYIEMKSPEQYPNIAEKLSTAIEESGLKQTVNWYIQSFDLNNLLTFHVLQPELPLIFLTKEPIADEQLDQIKNVLAGVGLHKEIATPKLIQQLQAANLDVHVYTVNSKKEMNQFLQWGVDGIFTDRPEMLYHLIQ